MQKFIDILVKFIKKIKIHQYLEDSSICCKNSADDELSFAHMSMHFGGVPSQVLHGPPYNFCDWSKMLQVGWPGLIGPT